MHSVLWAVLALSNVPLFLQGQEFLPDVQWPTHAVVALPQAWVKQGEQLFVLENDQPFLGQIEIAAHWPDGSPKWVHVYGSFRYTAGKPARYVLAKAEKPPEAPRASPLKIEDRPERITIDTGVVKLVIARPFAGITRVEHDGKVVVDGLGGPTMIDARGITWRAADDTAAEVVFEQQGPTQVTIKASGWYQTEERRVAPFCRFATRITVFAESAIVRVDHATIFADDMRKHAISELAFKVAIPQATGFSSGTINGKFSDHLAAMYLAQLSADKQLLLAQHTPQEPRVPEVTGTSDRSPGWFSVEVADRRVALLAKDFWQKFPKEVKLGAEELTYYAWPKHGQLAPADDDAVRLDQIYKFDCFHRGKLLDGRLPNPYFSALEAQTDTTECRAVYARAANLEGVAMRNEFALVFLAPSDDAGKDKGHVAQLAQLYFRNPIARSSPAAMAASGALGPVAPSGSDFAAVHATVRDGMLGYARSVERYGDYGWAIYGNTHHDELMNPAAAGVPGGRPSLHRVWNNNHYQQVSICWRLFALDGDPRLMQWARTSTDCFSSVGQVRYDALRGYTDGKGQVRPGPGTKYHNPGGFYHCKGLVPWGGRDYGMDTNDVDAALVGHWPDPSGLLLAWFLDGDRWAKDGFDLWRQNVKLPTAGTRREVNNMLVHAITAYEYQPTPELLQNVRSLGQSLRSMPLVDQHPGPLWEPTWLSRYHELLPDDEAFNKYIVESADAVGVMSENIWSLALCATAYRITKNEEYLRRHAATLERTVRRLFRDPVADKRWQNYGLAPGPDRDGHFALQWHRFSAALRDAKITSLAPPDEPGQYFCDPSRYDSSDDVAAHGTRIYFLKPEGAAQLDLQATTLSGGDIHATSLELLSPAGKSLLREDRLAMAGGKQGGVPKAARPSSWLVWKEKHPVPAGDPGLYSVLVGSYQIGLFQALTPYPECQVLRSVESSASKKPAVHLAKLTKGFLVPTTTGKIRLTFTARGERDGSYLSIAGHGGESVLAQWLRAGDKVSVTLNQRGVAAGPWLLDAFSDYSGYFQMSIEAETERPLLYGRRLEDIEQVRAKLGKIGGPVRQANQKSR